MSEQQAPQIDAAGQASRIAPLKTSELNADIAKVINRLKKKHGSRLRGIAVVMLGEFQERFTVRPGVEVFSDNDDVLKAVNIKEVRNKILNGLPDGFFESGGMEGAADVIEAPIQCSINTAKASVQRTLASFPSDGFPSDEDLMASNMNTEKKKKYPALKTVGCCVYQFI